jgi:hypothetical protein
MSNEERIVRSLALGSYYNPYQEKFQEVEASVLKERQDQEVQTRKLKLCRAIRKQAKRAQFLRVKKKKASVNLLKTQKKERASQWQKQREDDYERVKFLCGSIQASRNAKRYLLEQKREVGNNNLYILIFSRSP